MKFLARSVAVMALATLSAACTGDARTEQPAVPASSAGIAAPDVIDALPGTGPDARACKAQGGFVAKRGRLETAMCVHPYADAGKACRDNLECEGKCVAPVDDGPDGQIVGQCQADDALFGCYAEVVDGKSVRAICVD